MEQILIPLAFFATIVLIVYIFYTSRNKERLALINKGVGAEIFNKIPQASLFSFKIGFFLIGIGIGSLIGNIVAVNTALQQGVAYFSMILLFGGASLVIFHLLEKRIVQNYKKLN
jgi:predicted MFS family arabinose efflux permease